MVFQELKPYTVHERTKEIIEYRNLPTLEEIKNFLNHWRAIAGFTIDEVESILESQAPHHWFNGESYPTKEDWLKIKELLKFPDTYDKVMTTVFIKSSKKIDNPTGKNPGDVWYG